MTILNSILAVGSSDFLDRLTLAVTILFLLSVITEKLTQFVRQYPRQLQYINMGVALYFTAVSAFSCVRAFETEENGNPWIYLGLFFLFGILVFYALKLMQGANWTQKINPLPNIAQGSNFLSDEAKAEEISLLSFFAGAAIAFSFQADFLNIMMTDQLDFEIWNPPLIEHFKYFNPKLEFSVIQLGSILVTGFFLSFGSKFFHDLLDLIFEVKNARRKLNDDQLKNLKSVDAINEYRTLFAYEEAQRAVKQNDHLTALANVLQVVPGVDLVDGQEEPVVEFFLNDLNDQNIPSHLPVTLKSGGSFKVRTVVNFSQKIPTAHFMVGDTLNREDSSFDGAVGPILQRLKDSKRVILTCAHVVNEGQSKSIGGELTAREQFEVIQKETQAKIGDCIYEMRNSLYDVALIQISGNKTNDIGPGKHLSDVAYTATPHDTGVYSRVVMVGAKSGEAEGVIRNIRFSTFIRYQDQVVEMAELIMISKGSYPNWQTMSQGGDSGSLVYMKNTFCALGIVIGGSEEYTLVIPIDRILEKLDLKIPVI